MALSPGRCKPHGPHAESDDGDLYGQGYGAEATGKPQPDQRLEQLVPRRQGRRGHPYRKEPRLIRELTDLGDMKGLTILIILAATCIAGAPTSPHLAVSTVDHSPFTLVARRPEALEPLPFG